MKTQTLGGYEWKQWRNIKLFHFGKILCTIETNYTNCARVPSRVFATSSYTGASFLQWAHHGAYMRTMKQMSA